MTAAGAETSTLVALHRTMVRIRTFEERVAELVTAKEVRTPCHLYIGQEAVAAGVCGSLTDDDYVWGGHRSHGHYLAKQADLKSMMAEILGKTTGCSGGRGGSMHLCAPSKGILGTVPLVAATIPLAVGSALASKLRKEPRVSVAFFGDGAMEEGHCHESMNLAALYRLPVLFVCENNFYASHMHLRERRLEPSLVKSAQAHGIPASLVDGNDVEAVLRTARDAAHIARSGGGPSFLECTTYRWRGHVGPSWDMDVGVKRSDELKEWLPKDPIARSAKALQQRGVNSQQLDEITSEATAEVAAAVEFARSSSSPSIHTLEDHVFKSR